MDTSLMGSSVELEAVYRVERNLSSAGSAYYFESMHTRLERVSGYEGYVVRYGGWLWKLHPEKEFARFVRDAKQTGTAIYVGSAQYSPTRHPSFSFFLAWDRPIGQGE
jgi:hypothetical protein